MIEGTVIEDIKALTIKLIKVSSIIMISLGAIVLLAGLIPIFDAVARLGSIGSFDPVYLLRAVDDDNVYAMIRGICYLVFGIVALSNCSKQGNGNLIIATGIVFITIYTIALVIYLSAFYYYDESWLILGLFISIVCSLLFIIAGNYMKKIWQALTSAPEPEPEPEPVSFLY